MIERISIPAQTTPPPEPTKADKIAKAIIEMVAKTGAGDLGVTATEYPDTLDGVAWILKQEAKRYRAKH